MRLLPLAFISTLAVAIALGRTPVERAYADPASPLKVTTLFPDSGLAVGAFFMPADDGHGAIDSVAVRFIGLPASLEPPRIVYAPPPAAGARQEYQFRFALPLISPGSWSFFVQILTWRRTLNGEYLTPKVVLTVSDTAPPAVTGSGFTVDTLP